MAVPLFCVGLMITYLAARVGTPPSGGQGSGVYDHYFNTFLCPTGTFWSPVEAVDVVALMIMLVHLLRLRRTWRPDSWRGGRPGRVLDGRRVDRNWSTTLVIDAPVAQSSHLAT